MRRHTVLIMATDFTSFAVQVIELAEKIAKEQNEIVNFDKVTSEQLQFFFEEGMPIQTAAARIVTNYGLPVSGAPDKKIYGQH